MNDPSGAMGPCIGINKYQVSKGECLDFSSNNAGCDHGVWGQELLENPFLPVNSFSKLGELSPNPIPHFMPSPSQMVLFARGPISL